MIRNALLAAAVAAGVLSAGAPASAYCVRVKGQQECTTLLPSRCWRDDEGRIWCEW
ncbi:MAG TPA: hypothetical protein VF519_04625 [Mycobacteriales bacterium]|jgi:hypothetical protein